MIDTSSAEMNEFSFAGACMLKLHCQTVVSQANHQKMLHFTHIFSTM